MTKILVALSFFSIILLSILTIFRISAADVDSTQIATPDPDSLANFEPSFELRRRQTEVAKPASVPFGVGEKFTFSIEYGPIKAGTASLEIQNIEIIDGHPCYRITSLAKSGKTFSLFFRVRDEVNSHMDIYSLFTRRFTKKLEEGKYRAKQEINFDQQNHIATYHNNKQYELPQGVHDVLSAFYYTRCLNLEVGSEIEIETHADKKNYPMLVKVHRKETIKVPAGEFDCLVVEPVMRSTGIFKQKGKLTVWLTDDEIKMPVLMKSKVFIGSINAKLRAYTLGMTN